MHKTTETSELIKERIEKLEHLKKDKNLKPYGERFLPVDKTSSMVAEFEEKKEVRAAGRLMAKREHGKSIFGDLRDSGGKIQLYVKQDAVGGENFRPAREVESV